MKFSTNLKKVALGVSLAVAGITSANAAVLITEWDIFQEFEFTEWTATAGDGGITATGDDGGFIDGRTSLAWGDVPDGAMSSLVIDSPVNAEGVATSDDGILAIGDFANGPSLTHNNFPISVDWATLDTAVAQDYIQLTAVDPAGFEIVRNLSFDINFAETLNTMPAADCTWGGSPDACADIFTIGGESLFDTPVDVAGSDLPAFEIDSFITDGYLYTVYLQATGLQVLSDDACIEAGADLGCVGLVTAEDASNFIQLSFAIAAEEIPEPGIIALIGVGLLGMAGIRRKKKVTG